MPPRPTNARDVEEQVKQYDRPAPPKPAPQKPKPKPAPQKPRPSIAQQAEERARQYDRPAPPKPAPRPRPSQQQMDRKDAQMERQMQQQAPPVSDADVANVRQQMYQQYANNSTGSQFERTKFDPGAVDAQARYYAEQQAAYRQINENFKRKQAQEQRAYQLDQLKRQQARKDNQLDALEQRRAGQAYQGQQANQQAAMDRPLSQPRYDNTASAPQAITERAPERDFWNDTQTGRVLNQASYELLEGGLTNRVANALQGRDAYYPTWQRGQTSENWSNAVAGVTGASRQGMKQALEGWGAPTHEDDVDYQQRLDAAWNEARAQGLNGREANRYAQQQMTGWQQLGAGIADPINLVPTALTAGGSAIGGTVGRGVAATGRAFDLAQAGLDPIGTAVFEGGLRAAGAVGRGVYNAMTAPPRMGIIADDPLGRLLFGGDAGPATGPAVTPMQFPQPEIAPVTQIPSTVSQPRYTRTSMYGGDRPTEQEALGRLGQQEQRYPDDRAQIDVDLDVEAEQAAEAYMAQLDQYGIEYDPEEVLEQMRETGWRLEQINHVRQKLGVTEPYNPGAARGPQRDLLMPYNDRAAGNQNAYSDQIKQLSRGARDEIQRLYQTHERLLDQYGIATERRGNLSDSVYDPLFEALDRRVTEMANIDPSAIETGDWRKEPQVRAFLDAYYQLLLDSGRHQNPLDVFTDFIAANPQTRLTDRGLVQSQKQQLLNMNRSDYFKDSPSKYPRGEQSANVSAKWRALFQVDSRGRSTFDDMVALANSNDPELRAWGERFVQSLDQEQAVEQLYERIGSRMPRASNSPIPQIPERVQLDRDTRQLVEMSERMMDGQEDQWLGWFETLNDRQQAALQDAYEQMNLLEPQRQGQAYLAGEAENMQGDALDPITGNEDARKDPDLASYNVGETYEVLRDTGDIQREGLQRVLSDEYSDLMPVIFEMDTAELDALDEGRRVALLRMLEDLQERALTPDNIEGSLSSVVQPIRQRELAWFRDNIRAGQDTVGLVATIEKMIRPGLTDNLLTGTQGNAPVPPRTPGERLAQQSQRPTDEQARTLAADPAVLNAPQTREVRDILDRGSVTGPKAPERAAIGSLAEISAAWRQLAGVNVDQAVQSAVKGIRQMTPLERMQLGQQALEQGWFGDLYAKIDPLASGRMSIAPTAQASGQGIFGQGPDVRQWPGVRRDLLRGLSDPQFLDRLNTRMGSNVIENPLQLVPRSAFKADPAATAAGEFESLKNAMPLGTAGRNAAMNQATSMKQLRGGKRETPINPRLVIDQIIAAQRPADDIEGAPFRMTSGAPQRGDNALIDRWLERDQGPDVDDDGVFADLTVDRVPNYDEGQWRPQQDDPEADLTIPDDGSPGILQYVRDAWKQAGDMAGLPDPDRLGIKSGGQFDPKTSQNRRDIAQVLKANGFTETEALKMSSFFTASHGDVAPDIAYIAEQARQNGVSPQAAISAYLTQTYKTDAFSGTVVESADEQRVRQAEERKLEFGNRQVAAAQRNLASELVGFTPRERMQIIGVIRRNASTPEEAAEVLQELADDIAGSPENSGMLLAAMVEAGIKNPDKAVGRAVQSASTLNGRNFRNAALFGLGVAGASSIPWYILQGWNRAGDIDQIQQYQQMQEDKEQFQQGIQQQMQDMQEDKQQFQSDMQQRYDASDKAQQAGMNADQLLDQISDSLSFDEKALLRDVSQAELADIYANAPDQKTAEAQARAYINQFLGSPAPDWALQSVAESEIAIEDAERFYEEVQKSPDYTPAQKREAEAALWDARDSLNYFARWMMETEGQTVEDDKRLATMLGLDYNEVMAATKDYGQTDADFYNDYYQDEQSSGKGPGLSAPLPPGRDRTGGTSAGAAGDAGGPRHPERPAPAKAGTGGSRPATAPTPWANGVPRSVPNPVTGEWGYIDQAGNWRKQAPIQNGGGRSGPATGPRDEQFRYNPRTGAPEFYDARAGAWLPTAPPQKFSNGSSGSEYRDEQFRYNPRTGIPEFYDAKAGTWLPTAAPVKNEASSGPSFYDEQFRYNPRTGRPEFYDARTGAWLPTAKPQRESDAPKKTRSWFDPPLEGESVTRKNPATGEWWSYYDFDNDGTSEWGPTLEAGDGGGGSWGGSTGGGSWGGSSGGRRSSGGGGERSAVSSWGDLDGESATILSRAVAGTLDWTDPLVVATLAKLKLSRAQVATMWTDPANYTTYPRQPVLSRYD